LAAMEHVPRGNWAKRSDGSAKVQAGRNRGKQSDGAEGEKKTANIKGILQEKRCGPSALGVPPRATPVGKKKKKVSRWKCRARVI